MTGRYLERGVPAVSTDGPVPAAAKEAVRDFCMHMDDGEPHRALEAVWKLLKSRSNSRGLDPKRARRVVECSRTPSMSLSRGFASPR